MDTGARVELFREIISSGQMVYSWTYDLQGEIISGNSPDPSILDEAFAQLGCKAYMLKYAQSNTRPLILGSGIGLTWAAAVEQKNGAPQYIHLLGPVFAAEVSLEQVRKALRRMDIPMALQGEMAAEFEKLPVMSATFFMQYALMLHCCVTGEKLDKSDIQHQTSGKYVKDDELKTNTDTDRHRTYMIEQGVLRMVREGDLNYKQAREQGAMVSSGVRISIGEPLRQMKVTSIVFTSLCVRAAIEGGLVPDTAYSGGDRYMRAAELAGSLPEIVSINSQMYEDFVQRVHKCHVNPDYSPAVQACCDYISMHTDERLTTDLLASRVGYAPYYLTRKFRQEVGVSLNSYIKYAKIERAKLLLATTDASMQDIAERLHFSSRSYFADAFQKVVGITPSQYREQGGKIM